MVDNRVLIGYYTSVRPIEINNQGANEMKLSETTERTLIPESDIDKAVLLNVVESAVKMMPEWIASDGRVLSISIAEHVVNDQGEVPAKLVYRSAEFDPMTVISDADSEEMTITVEMHGDNRAVAVWHCGNDSNLVAANCWVVR